MNAPQKNEGKPPLLSKENSRSFCQRRKLVDPTRPRLITPARRNSRQRISKIHPLIKETAPLHASSLNAQSLLISRRKEEIPFHRLNRNLPTSIADLLRLAAQRDRKLPKVQTYETTPKRIVLRQPAAKFSQKLLQLTSRPVRPQFTSQTIMKNLRPPPSSNNSSAK